MSGNKRQQVQCDGCQQWFDMRWSNNILNFLTPDYWFSIYNSGTTYYACSPACIHTIVDRDLTHVQTERKET